MGQSSSSYLNEITSEMNQAIFSQMTNVTNNNTTSCKINQTQSFVNGPTGVINCGINFSQNAQSVCNLAATFNTTQNNNISTIINAAIQQMATQSQTATQQFLSAAFSSNQSSASIVSHIQNVISTNLSSSTINTCLLNNEINQQGVFQNNGVLNCSPCLSTNTCIPGVNSITVGQNAQIQSLSNCVTNAVITTLANDQLTSSIAQKASQTQVTTQQGVFSILSFLTSPTAVIIIIVIAIVLVVGGVFYFKSKSGQGPQGQQMAAQMTPQQAQLAQSLLGGTGPTGAAAKGSTPLLAEGITALEAAPIIPL